MRSRFWKLQGSDSHTLTNELSSAFVLNEKTESATSSPFVCVCV